VNAPYARRAINLTFKMGTGSFGGSGFNTITHQGLRVIFDSEWSNAPSQPKAIIRVYGLTLSEMNELTKAGLFYTTRNDKVQVDAGDVGGQMTTVFVGTINEAYPDLREMPDSAFMITALGGGEHNLKPVQPVTFSGSVPFATAMQQILAPTGLTLENNGVNAVFASPYFPGSAMAQINRAVTAANCFACIDTLTNTVATWPKKNGSRGGNVPVISRQTGMIGYPEFERNFIRVRALFSGERFQGPGRKIQVQSDLKAANGTWNVINADLHLASELDGGPWEIMIRAWPVS